MITGEIKNQIDQIWDTFWVGGITNSMSVLEQMTYLFFMKMLDDAQLKKEASANILGVSISNPTFKDGSWHNPETDRDVPYNALRWHVFKNMEATQMFNTIRTDVFAFIKNLNEGKSSAYSRFMRDAVFLIQNPRTLTKIVDGVDALDMSNRDEELDTLAQSIFYDMFGDPVTNEKGWEVKKLGELCETITKGTTPSSLGYSFTDDGVNFIKVESFNKDESINTSKIFHISIECDAVLKRSRLQENDILMCIAGATCGRLAVVPAYILPANTNQAFGIVRLKNKNLHFFKFIYYYLHSAFIQNRVNELMKGVAQPNLTLAHLKNFLIILPPLPLQQQFASKIEAIEHQKELIKQSIKETETLFNSRMDYYFN